MNKVMFFILTIMMFNGLYGMEVMEQKEVNKKKVSTFIFSTNPKIVVCLDDIYNRSEKNADVTIVGETEQLVLKNKTMCNSPHIGCVLFTHKGPIKRKSSALTNFFDYSYGFRGDSAAIRIQGEQFIINNIHPHIEEITMKNKIFIVHEPQVFVTPKKNGKLAYHYIKVFHEEHKTQLSERDFFGEKAITQALKDLAVCYKGVLVMGNSYFKDKPIKSIAFPPLSMSLGIPAYRAIDVAVKTVINFINKYLDKVTYESIEFVVPHMDDFNLYVATLNAYTKDSLGKIIPKVVDSTGDIIEQ